LTGYALQMTFVKTGRLIAAAIGFCGLLACTPVPSAEAEPCPDVEVIFARGTSEPPGVGGVGQAFVDAVRSQAGTRSVGVYPINYPAANNFDDRVAFASTVIEGIKDGSAHIQSMATSCPNTRMVLGGYSQGAVVAGFVTSATVPQGLPAGMMPQPMPPAVADHVAAVALFGKPSDAWMSQYGAPPITIGPAYAAKTVQECAQGDTICDGTPGGGPTFAHGLYPVNGMVDDAATFVTSRF
jgi:cutinase-like protein